ncbi:MAG: noncanonical pyrimidine nucleotidase, YjjG family [Saprospiraceae bacterium]|nr:noncanonical pyrimidine nucleotidase, YjjG family [Saprospiraceae bacterium]
MNPKPYDWLLFDLDNTILDFKKSSIHAFHAIMQENGLERDDSDYALFSSINKQVWEEMESGQINHQELKVRRWDMYAEAKSMNLDSATANARYFQHIRENSFYVDFAKEMLDLTYAHFNLMIITNGLGEVQRPRILNTGLDQYFDHIVISDELGYAKPNTAYFEHCHNLIGGWEKDRVLVIGDTPGSDIKGGNDFGYNTCWYNHSDQLSSEIKPDYEIAHLKELRRILLV